MNQQEHYSHLPESFRPVAEVAVAYFPNYAYVRSSIRKFRQEVARDVPLCTELTEAGYSPAALQLTPKQLSIIFAHWGVPGGNSRFSPKEFDE